MKTRFETPLGSYRIQRLPQRNHETLQAWDAADELLLNHLLEQHPQFADKLLDGRGLLLVNDQFGALATALHQYSPDSWGDSSVSHLATQINYTDNFPAPSSADKTESFNAISSVKPLSNSYAIVLIKVPKTLALLEQQLVHLNGHVDNNSLIIASGMTKNIHTSTLNLFEKLLGITTTSKASKKARLIFCQVDTDLLQKNAEQSDPNNALIASTYFCKPLNAELSSYANGFSRDHLDIGSRAMLRAMLTAMEQDNLPDANSVADLACGNGVLGLYALALLELKSAELTSSEQDNKALATKIDFIDESYMAVAASEKNYQTLFSSQDPVEGGQSDAAFEHKIDASFYAQDGFGDETRSQYDWIICNPPFHIGTTVDTLVANRMFEQSYKALQRGGQLWIVANRHLKYGESIQRLFKNQQTIYSDSKFIVLACSKK